MAVSPGVFYRPPHCSDHVSLLNQSLANVPTSTNLVLCGDFNAPDINWNSVVPLSSYQPSVTLCDLINDFGLIQLVQDPTRVDNILDLLLTNTPAILDHVNVTDGLCGSDHDSVVFDVCLCRPHSHIPPRKAYNFY